MNTIIIHNQNLLDIAIQEHGDVRAVIELAFKNGLNITDILPIGSKLEIKDSLHSDSDVLNYYKRNSIKPATANPIQPIQDLSGIDYWTIGENFIVQ